MWRKTSMSASSRLKIGTCRTSCMQVAERKTERSARETEGYSASKAWYCSATGSSMCKHILNAQAQIRSPCCLKWFDCPECHAEQADHPLRRTLEMVFACKKCRKTFRKDMTAYEESDEYCPHCDNHYVIEAKEAHAMLSVEGEDARMDARMLKDERVQAQQRQLLEDELLSEKLI